MLFTNAGTVEKGEQGSKGLSIRTGTLVAPCFHFYLYGVVLLGIKILVAVISLENPGPPGVYVHEYGVPETFLELISFP